MLHTLFLFWRSFYEVCSENSQALLLGARRAFFRVSSVVVLLACLIQPSFAEFTSTDSNNLADIKNNKLVTIINSLSTANSRLSSVVSSLSTITSQLSSTGTLQVALNSIVNNTQVIDQHLTALSSKFDTLFTFLSDWFSYELRKNYILGLDSINPADENIPLAYRDSSGAGHTIAPESTFWRWDIASSDAAYFYFGYGNLKLLDIGVYRCFLITPFTSQVPDLRVLNSDVSLLDKVDETTYYAFYYQIDVKAPINVSDLVFYIDSSTFTSQNTVVRFYLWRADDYAQYDSSFGASVNPGQSSVNDSISSAVSDLDDFDNQIFSDFDEYKSDLDFGLSAWGEAVAGISYIGNIFMIIWDNSPNQVIVLSLMLGLCCLVLGRGAKLARAARRSNRGADDG